MIENIKKLFLTQKLTITNEHFGSNARCSHATLGYNGLTLTNIYNVTARKFFVIKKEIVKLENITKII